MDSVKSKDYSGNKQNNKQPSEWLIDHLFTLHHIQSFENSLSTRQKCFISIQRIAYLYDNRF